MLEENRAWRVSRRRHLEDIHVQRRAAVLDRQRRVVRGRRQRAERSVARHQHVDVPAEPGQCGRKGGNYVADAADLATRQRTVLGGAKK